MADPLDKDMVQASAGDQRAFARVVEASHVWLRAVLTRECADIHLADEMAQSAYVKAWEKRDLYQAGSSPKAWILTIARNDLKSHYRKTQVRQRHREEEIAEVLIRESRHEHALPRLEDDRMDALEACLDELEPNPRKLIDHVFHLGFSTEEAAQALGISAAACRKRLSRLYGMLRDCVENKKEAWA